MATLHQSINRQREQELLALEAQFSSGHGDRESMHRKLNELKSILSFEANPVLRTEYVRRMALLDGTSASLARKA